MWNKVSDRPLYRGLCVWFTKTGLRLSKSFPEDFKKSLFFNQSHSPTANSLSWESAVKRFKIQGESPKDL